MDPPHRKGVLGLRLKVLSERLMTIVPAYVECADVLLPPREYHARRYSAA